MQTQKTPIQRLSKGVETSTEKLIKNCLSKTEQVIYTAKKKATAIHKVHRRR